MSIGSLQQDSIVEVGPNATNTDGSASGTDLLPPHAYSQNIVFDTIDAYENTQGLMIKTYPSAAGVNAGFVRNVRATNFRLWRSTYTAYIQQYWLSKTTPDGAGVQISDVTFDNWSGSNVYGYQRGAVVMVGSKFAPPHDIKISNFHIWSEKLHGAIGQLNKCSNSASSSPS